MYRSVIARTVFFFGLVIGVHLGNGGLWAEEGSNDRMNWWREAKFGMFIHWGVYTVPAGNFEGNQVEGIGEWIMQHAQIPLKPYKDFARQFNPAKYDPEAWAALAHQAGMKYIVITAKHHDGFALYDSDVTDWDIVGSSPYSKDLLAPLASAARKQGLKFGLYYSQAQDWTHPGGAKAGFEDHQGWDDLHKGSFDEYLAKIAVPQTREILNRYQPDVLWWDTPALMTPERAKPLRELLDSHPKIITNDRLGGGYPGDTKTPEQYIPETGLAGDWETCMTLNDTWGYKNYDHNWKSTETLIRNLVDIISKGGNYLLNVGPNAEGEIPQASIERLQAIGEWMAVNGAAIYGTTGSPCRAPAWGRLACRDDHVFLFVFDWPADGQLPVSVKADVRRCHLLANPERSFVVSSDDDGLVVELTGDTPDEICSVVVLDVIGPVEGIVPRIRQQVDGSLILQARDSISQGSHVRVEQIGNQPNIGYWESPSDVVEWPCMLAEPGKFAVVAEVATPAPSQFTFQCGAAELQVQVAATGNYDTFKTAEIGQITVTQAGELTVAIKPIADGWHAINLRRIVLRSVP